MAKTQEDKDRDRNLRFDYTGNCNMKYLTGLGSYYPNPRYEKGKLPRRMEDALFDALNTPPNRNPWGGATNSKNPSYNSAGMNCGIVLFAQGSEDPEKDNPYARTFARLVRKYKLGRVKRIPPTPNPMHGNKLAITYVWRVDHKACKAWWKVQADLRYKGIQPIDTAAQQKQINAEVNNA